MSEVALVLVLAVLAAVVASVAIVRVLPTLQLQLGALAAGEHRFECLIHPWMRVVVEQSG